MSSYHQKYLPRCRVIVRELGSGKIKPIGPAGDGDLSLDIISISTNKAYGRAAGTFQINLPYRVMPGAGLYSEAIFSDDNITIEMDAGDGKGYQAVMTGLVDRPARKFDASGPLPIRNVSITGQDLGKLLQKSDIGWDVSGIQAQPAEPEVCGVQNTGEATIFTDRPPPLQAIFPPQGEGRPDIIATSYMRRLVLTANTAAGMTEELFKMFQASIRIAPTFKFTATTDDDWMVWDPTMQFIKGTKAWEAMKIHEHNPWNTLTTETIDTETFEVRLERTPHGENGKLTVRTWHTVEAVEIVGEDLAASDVERVNLVCYWPTLFRSTVSDQMDIVLADPNLTKYRAESIQQHGYCPHIISDEFIPPQAAVSTAVDTGAADAALPAVRNRAGIYWQWYSNNHNLESGTMVLHLSPQIKTGHGILVPQPGTDYVMEYLVEQVTHQMTFHPAPSFTTTLQLTRGQKH